MKSSRFYKKGAKKNQKKKTSQQATAGQTVTVLQDQPRLPGGTARVLPSRQPGCRHSDGLHTPPCFVCIRGLACFLLKAFFGAFLGTS